MDSSIRPAFERSVQSKQDPLRAKELGAAAIRSRSALNVSILDHLLATPRHQRTVAYVQNLSTYAPDEKALIDPHLEDGGRASELVQLVAESSGGTLKILASDAPLDERQRLALIDVALRAVDSNPRLADPELEPYIHQWVTYAKEYIERAIDNIPRWRDASPSTAETVTTLDFDKWLWSTERYRPSGA